MRGKAALMAAAFLALTGCSGSDGQGAVTNGTVIGKRYLAPSTSFVTTKETKKKCDANGKNCKTETEYDQHPVNNPECWRLNLKADDGRIGPVCVSQQQYDQIKEGDHFNG